MKTAKTIGLWILAIFFALSAMVYFPSVSSLFALLIITLVIPIPRWQSFLKNFIRGKIKTIIVIVLVILTMFTAPSSEPATTPTTEPSAAPTAEPSAAPTAEPTAAPTAEPTAAPTAEPTTAPTAEPTTAPTAEPTTAPTTEPPHVHSFSAATCTAPKTCSCGATEGSANGHSWKEATYTSPKTCTNCGVTEGSPLEVPGEENYHGHVYTGGEYSKKYHYEADCAGKYSHEITWEEVDRRGLEPCGTCVLK